MYQPHRECSQILRMLANAGIFLENMKTCLAVYQAVIRTKGTP